MVLLLVFGLLCIRIVLDFCGYLLTLLFGVVCCSLPRFAVFVMIYLLGCFGL